MHWVIQQHDFREPGWRSLIETLQRFEVPHSFHTVVPFVGTLIPEPAVAQRSVICMGAYSMRHTARRYAWTPGVFDLEEQHFLRQREHWGQHLLNAHSQVVAFGDVHLEEPSFLRPVDDTKSFSGRVFEPLAFHEWQRSVLALGDDSHTLRSSSLVQVARPVTIHAEYRCWMVRDRVVTASLYKRGRVVFSSSDVPEPVLRYANERASEWRPHEAYVMDVAETATGLRIIELNTLNAAGLYAADVQKLVMELENAFP
jgi:hypothetical protein